MKTSHCQIIECRGAAVLASDDVINLERESVMRIGNPAVFAPVLRALPNLPDQQLVQGWDDVEPSDFKSGRALDCRIDNRLPTCR